MAAFKDAGLEGKMSIALDVAASELFDTKRKVYNLDFKDKAMQNPQLITGQ